MRARTLVSVTLAKWSPEGFISAGFGGNPSSKDEAMVGESVEVTYDFRSDFITHRTGFTFCSANNRSRDV
jgi:hypothetical protein